MRAKNPTEEEYKQMLGRMGRAGGSTDARRTTESGSRRDPAIHKTTSRRSESAPLQKKRLYDSKWEETYASELVLRKHAGLIHNYWYHPFSMWLPGKVRYSPDFMIEYPHVLEKRLEIIEVKGWSKNLRDGMTRLKIAAAIFSCYTWKLVKKRRGGGWDEEEI